MANWQELLQLKTSTWLRANRALDSRSHRILLAAPYLHDRLGNLNGDESSRDCSDQRSLDQAIIADEA